MGSVSQRRLTRDHDATTGPRRAVAHAATRSFVELPPPTAWTTCSSQRGRNRNTGSLGNTAVLAHAAGIEQHRVRPSIDRPLSLASQAGVRGARSSRSTTAAGETCFSLGTSILALRRSDAQCADSESVRAGVLATILANDGAAVVLSSDSTWLCFRTDLEWRVSPAIPGRFCGVGCWSPRQRRLTLVRRRYLAPGDTDRSTGPLWWRIVRDGRALVSAVVVTDQMPVEMLGDLAVDR